MLKPREQKLIKLKPPVLGGKDVPLWEPCNCQCEMSS